MESTPPVDELLTANQAAHLLGVTRKTLYAYVSRGWIESQAGPGPSRARRYPRRSVEAHRDRVATPAPLRAASSALRFGAPVLESQLTLIDGGRFFYRGVDAVELSRSATLEQVASLLWTGTTGQADDLFHDEHPSAPSGHEQGLPLDSVAAMLLAAARANPVSIGSPATMRLRAAARLVGAVFQAAGASGHGPLARRLARGWGVRDHRPLQAALVVSADHELNVSAFTARCVASADSKLEHVLLAALSAFQGRRHGGMADRVHALLDDADALGVDEAIQRALAIQGEVPGFGHPLYPDGDPRGGELVRLARAPRTSPITRLVDRCAADYGLAPNLDFGLAALVRRLGLPPDRSATLFALGRSVGWLAHAFETWDDGSLIRPRARYIGHAPPKAGQETDSLRRT